MIENLQITICSLHKPSADVTSPADFIHIKESMIAGSCTALWKRCACCADLGVRVSFQIQWSRYHKLKVGARMLTSWQWAGLFWQSSHWIGCTPRAEVAAVSVAQLKYGLFRLYATWRVSQSEELSEHEHFVLPSDVSYR